MHFSSCYISDWDCSFADLNSQTKSTEIPQCTRHLKLIFFERHPGDTRPGSQGYDVAFFELLYKRLKLFIHRSPGPAEGYGGDPPVC